MQITSVTLTQHLLVPICASSVQTSSQDIMTQMSQPEQAEDSA